MSNKIIASMTMMALLLVQTGCSGGTGAGVGGKTLEEIAAEPFTEQYEYTEAGLLAYTDNDDLDTLMMAGPLYTGRTAFQQPGLKTFQDMKTALVAELMTKVEANHQAAVLYASDLKGLKDQYVDFLGQTLEVNNKLAKQMKPMVKDIIGAEVEYTTNFALYNSIDTSATSNAATSALLKYQKTYLAIQNVDLLTNDTMQTVAGLLALQEGLEGSSDSAMQAVGSTISTQVPAVVDTLGTKLAALQDGQAEIAHILKQIDSAEYYMAWASVDYVETNLLALQPSIDSLAPRGDVIMAEDVELMKGMATEFSEFNKQIKEQLQNVDRKTIIEIEGPVTEQNAFIPLAFADEQGYASKAFEMLKSTGKAAYQTGKSVGGVTWDAVKTTAKAVRTGAGVTLDTLGAATKTTADVIYGVGNGNSASEIASEIKGNFVKIGDNYNKGTSGADTWKTAEGYFEGAEKAGGDLAAGAVESTIGKGWTSWMAGHVGKITVNMFTGLGKGITKVANPNSSTGEIVEGALDVGLSFIGGSKVLMSGSQFAKGSKEAIKTLGKKGVNFLGRVLQNGDIKALKGISAEILTNTKLTPDMVKTLISNASRIEFKEGLQAELIQISKKLNQEFMGLLKEGGATIMDNATVGAKKAYSDFVKESFTNSLKGYKDALLGVLGKDMTAYIDNIVANKADDLLKTIVKEYVDKGLIRGINTTPVLSELGGKWSNGSMVITDVILSDEFRAQAEKEGCDLSELESQIGKQQSLGMTLTPTGESGGTMLLSLGGENPQTATFDYANGELSAKMSMEGALITLNMSISEEEEAFAAAGGIVVTYAEGGLKIIATASASKALPPPVVTEEE